MDEIEFRTGKKKWAVWSEDGRRILYDHHVYLSYKNLLPQTVVCRSKLFVFQEGKYRYQREATAQEIAEFEVQQSLPAE